MLFNLFRPLSDLLQDILQDVVHQLLAQNHVLVLIYTHFKAVSVVLSGLPNYLHIL